MKLRRTTRTSAVSEVLVLASLLAFGVIAWEQAVHVYLLRESNTLEGYVGNWLSDGALALPVGLVAALLAGLWSRMLRLGPSIAHLLARAGLASLFFVLLFVPYSGLVGAEADATLVGQLAHGLRDGLFGELVALPLAAAGIFLLSHHPHIGGRWPTWRPSSSAAWR
jgi:hypothetical protein